MRYLIDENGCWNFLGPKTKYGYGKVSLKDKTMQAHRLMAHITIKPLMSPNDVVAHKCDNPSCINPEHLFITNNAGNMRDRDLKNRNAKGSKAGNAKLSEDQVRDIRNRYGSGESMQKIASSVSVSFGCVQSIISGKTWRHLI